MNRNILNTSVTCLQRLGPVHLDHAAGTVPGQEREHGGVPAGGPYGPRAGSEDGGQVAPLCPDGEGPQGGRAGLTGSSCSDLQSVAPSLSTSHKALILLGPRRRTSRVDTFDRPNTDPNFNTNR